MGSPEVSRVRLLVPAREELEVIGVCINVVVRTVKKCQSRSKRTISKMDT